MSYTSSVAASLPVETLSICHVQEQSRGSCLSTGHLLSSQTTAVPTQTTYQIRRWATATLDTSFYGDACFCLFVRDLDTLNGKKLTHPLTVFVELDGESYLARNIEFEQVHGVGDTVEEAIEDFESCLVELYEDLSDVSATYAKEWHPVLDHLNELMG
jgi:predicted RNase H-like HicB family nuclease